MADARAVGKARAEEATADEGARAVGRRWRRRRGSIHRFQPAVASKSSGCLRSGLYALTMRLTSCSSHASAASAARASAGSKGMARPGAGR